MEDLSLHILDIVENSIDAGARQVLIRIVEDRAGDRLRIDIVDDGRGMDAATVERALDPFYTTRKTRRVGLGLSLFRESARETGGDMTIRSKPGYGTWVRATFQYGHIDRRPLGDMAATLETLIISHPEIRFRYRRRNDGQLIRIDSNRIMATDGAGIMDLVSIRRRLRAELRGDPRLKSK